MAAEDEDEERKNDHSKEKKVTTCSGRLQVQLKLRSSEMTILPTLITVDKTFKENVHVNSSTLLLVIKMVMGAIDQYLTLPFLMESRARTLPTSWGWGVETYT